MINTDRHLSNVDMLWLEQGDAFMIRPKQFIRSWWIHLLCKTFHREHWGYRYNPPIRILMCHACNLVLCIDDPKNDPCRLSIHEH